MHYTIRLVHYLSSTAPQVDPATLNVPLAMTNPVAISIGYACFAIDDPDLSRQLRELEEAGCEKVFSDIEVGSTSSARVGWRACMAMLDYRHVLVVSRLENLARSLAELSETLMELATRQIGLKVCHWDPAPAVRPGPLSEIVRRLTEFEAANRRVLTRSGLQAARAKGRVGGRRHRLSPEQIRDLCLLMSEPGADPEAVGKLFGVGRRTVYNYLRLHRVDV